MPVQLWLHWDLTPDVTPGLLNHPDELALATIVASLLFFALQLLYARLVSICKHWCLELWADMFIAKAMLKCSLRLVEHHYGATEAT